MKGELVIPQRAMTWVYIFLLSTIWVHAVHPASIQSNQVLQDHSRATTTTTSTPHRHRHHIRWHYRHSLVHHTPSRCTEGKFLRTLRSGASVCTTCSECPAGFGVKQLCSGRSDTICKSCDLGLSYLRDYFGVRKCFKCRKCENSEVVSECTPTSNRVCGACHPGFFRDDLTEECIACSYCYPEVPGYGIIEPMCVHKNQPSAYTCLPSLPPRHLRSTTTVTPTPRKNTLEDMVRHLDGKLRRLGESITSELKEVRKELNEMKTEVKTKA